jgi:hypothetical protein
MYAHLLSSAGVRDADLSFSGEDENVSGRDALGTGTPEISGARAERRSSAIGGTPPPRREPTVATVDALRETVPALNRALEDLGYPSPLELLLPDAADLARTCDVLFLLLRDRQEDLAARDAWADERARARADVAAAETRAERLRVSRDAEAAARAADANRRDRADDDSRARLERVTAERDAARRELRASTQKLARLEHETRRRELENDRLKARLSAIVESRETKAFVRDVEKARGGVTLVDKNVARRGGESDGKGRERGFGSARGGPGPSPAVSLALHHSMMSAYEAKLRAFMHDANDLRAMLRDAGVDRETSLRAVVGSAAPRPENVGERRSPRPADGAVAAVADGRAEVDGLDVEDGFDDEKTHLEDPTSASRNDATKADDAFAFNLASLRDRLGDEKETEEGRDDDARAAAAAAAEAAAPASPLEIALRWHEREHARLSKEAREKEALEEPEISSGSGSAPRSPNARARSDTESSERLAWNQKRDPRRDDAPARIRDARRAAPSSAPPDALLSASPEVSSSEPDEDEAGGRGGAFEAARGRSGDGSSSEEVFEEVFDPPDPPRATKPEPERLAPRREKVNTSARRDAVAGAALSGASAPASPASPLDALLARHLGASRAPAAGPPRDRGEWLERRRRRANPFSDADDVSVD